jgi:hypothetical protein
MMKHSRLVLAASAVLALGTWASLASACDDKASAAAASTQGSSTCSAAAASRCTAAMAATCKAKNASAMAAQGCPHGASSASASGCPYHNQASAAAAASGGCSGHASGVGAVTLSAQGSKGTVDAVPVGGPGCSHSSAAAATADAGGQCMGHGMVKTADRSNHSDCDACADMAFCDGEVRALGANVQIVPLKNGVMYVYTATDPGKVHAVQASMGHRNDRMLTILSAGDKVHLCPSCKSMRGAIASGKLSRELVNIEGGCLTLMTSNDPATLAKIYSLAGLKGPAAIKS